MTETFFRLHSDLAHEAPGSRADTLRALALTGVSGPVRILDAGCGPGAASAVLLEALPEADVVGMDLHAPFVAAAEVRCAGFGGRFRGIVGDMTAPEAGRFGMVWAEGSVYSVGVAAALAAWRDLLLPGGVVAFSEIVWTVAAPSAEARAYWARDYPAMGDAAAVRAAVAGAGYRLRGEFLLSRQAWDNYYLPLEARAAALEAEVGRDDPALVETRAEIDVWRRFGAEYGYGFFVAELP